MIYLLDADVVIDVQKGIQRTIDCPMSGRYGTSELLEAALRDQLRRERQRWTVEHGAGILKGEA